MSIKAQDAIAAARALLGTPYAELDCIGLIVRVIRTSPGGVPDYRTAGTNTLWRSATASAKYRDLTYTQEGTSGALGGMLAFKRSVADVHHVGIVAERPLCGMQRGEDRESQGAEGDYASSPGGDRFTVIHSSSAKGMVVETALDDSWHLLAVHRYIETLPQPTAPSGGSLTGDDDGKGGTRVEAYSMRVRLQDEDSTLNVRAEPGRGGDRIGRLHHGAVVTVQAEYENGWRFVRYGEGALGYVDGSYLEAVQEEAEEKPPEISIVDSAGNVFKPVGDFKVLIGSVD